MNKKIQIIIPCYNEEENIGYIVSEVDKYIGSLPYRYEFVFIDDGSSDKTYDAILDLSRKRDDINVIKLSRNFGKEAAIVAGLNCHDSDAAIIIDSDLQHPPHLIPALIAEWERGANIVDAVKIKRQKENIIVKGMSLTFNRVMSGLTGMDFNGSSDYKLLDKTAIDLLNGIQEKNRFFRGLTNWVGLTHRRIEFNVEDRKAGKTKWNGFKLFQLSVDAISSYSSKPLQIVTILGMFTLLFSIILGLQTLYNKFFGGAVSGFTTVILVVLILSSIIMISMGILGIYLSKVYNEVKNRPIYVIEAPKNARNSEKEEKSV
jgi:dolichol-phosphate mannosyltransferase